MTEAHIITGLNHGQQWLSPGVIVCVPDDTARAWVQAGLATVAAPLPNPAQAPTPVRKPKAKKAD